MPVREKAEMAVAPMLAGELHETLGQITGATSLTSEEFWDVCDFINELFVTQMEGIDFNRVILEAGGLCSDKQQKDPDHKPHARGFHRDVSALSDGTQHMELTFCADCFRLCILRMDKHEVMEQSDVEGTLPEERAPEVGWPMPRKLARRFAELLKERKESWNG